MLKRLLTLAFVFAALVLSQVNIQTVADLTGDGSVHPLSSTSTTARWIQLVAPSGNSAVVRWGDANISTTRGAVIAPGGGQLIPPFAPATGGSSISTLYNLSKIYYLAANSDKLTVTWGQ